MRRLSFQDAFYQVVPGDLDPSYKFSSSTLQFRGRLELLLCRGGTIDRHVGTIHATHRERYRLASGYIRSLGERESAYLPCMYESTRARRGARVW